MGMPPLKAHHDHGEGDMIKVGEYVRGDICPDTEIGLLMSCPHHRVYSKGPKFTIKV